MSFHPDKLPPYVWPVITKNVEKAVIQQLHTSISIYNRSGIFEEFENAFKEYHGRKHALLCSSGTLAIHTMFYAAGLTRGDEVICPTYTFFATVTPLLHTGATPVFCDIDKNGNIDPNEIQKKITSRTKAVIITHMWGIPCDMDSIVSICKKYNILLLEDCSHAHGATWRNRPVGSFGDMAAWSLQGSKIITAGEGGIVVTDNDELNYRGILLGHYNKRALQELPTTHALYPFAVTGAGLKYRAHPLGIAIALELFKQIDQILNIRRRYAKSLLNMLSKFKQIQIPELNEHMNPSWYALTFRYNPEDNGESSISAEKLYENFKNAGLTDMDRPFSTSPLHLLPLFQKPETLFPSYKDRAFTYAPGDFPKAEEFYTNTFKIPIWSEEESAPIMKEYEMRINNVLLNSHVR